MSSDERVAAARAEAHRCDAERRRLLAELEAAAVGASLPGAGGASAPLVDAEGFPVAGVDHFAVAAARQRVAMLRNDCRAADAALARALEALHAAQAHTRAPAAAAPAPAPAPVPTPPPAPMPALASAASAAAAAPFAVVGRVAAGSPAAEAGILPGDAVIALGSLRGTSITIDGSGAPIQIPAPRLEAVAAEVARSHGTALSVTVRRQGVDAPLTLSLTPHEWAGQGLLGCLLLPA